MAFKKACFSKNRSASGGEALRPQQPPAARGSGPRSPSVIRLTYASLLTTSPNFEVFTF